MKTKEVKVKRSQQKRLTLEAKVLRHMRHSRKLSVHEVGLEQIKEDDFLLPRYREWNKGGQATVLRKFCEGNKLRSIRFHTLRACFATQLISAGIPATVVMKICCWKDLKTMQGYIRLAGIDEAGATEGLHFIPTEEAAMEKGQFI